MPGSRPGAVSIPFDSPTHQRRVLTVVCAIECRQRLPAFRREPRNVSVSDVAEHFRGIRWFSRLIGCRRGCHAKRHAKPSCDGRCCLHVPRAEPRTGSLWFIDACGIARRFRVRRIGMTVSPPRPWKTGPAVCLISNLYHAQLSLPVCLEPSIHFTRPTATMSEQWGRNGAACLVYAQSASSSSQVGADVLEVRDQPVHQVAGPRRVCDDRVGRAVIVEFKRILTVADVAGIDAAQAEPFEMPHQGRRRQHTARQSCGCREGTGSAAPLPPVASGRNQPRGARSWIACPSAGPQGQ